MKIIVSFLLIRWVFTKIDGQLACDNLARAHILWLLAAILLFILSKLLSAVRLQLFFNSIQVNIPAVLNRQLYWLGMFYNLFLPGGIGGDAYKVLWLRKSRSNIPVAETTRAVLLDRISGMMAAVMIMLLLAPFIAPLPNWMRFASLPAAVAGCLAYIWLIKKQFKSFYPVLLTTSGYSLGVQLLQCICVWCLLQTFDVHASLPEYMLIFLLSSLVAVLPFTLGGIGARELVFLYGSRWLFLAQDVSVTVSLLFYLITAVVSLAGCWHFLSGKFSLKKAAPAA
ncbi:lysylphosphatidylglycerol synthase transmembrane domain-containing protein [Filimonas effusa]|nr:lysylphosphatidylglycerol synthase transmembrane domain-containing protein [Filimonas effusa]